MVGQKNDHKEAMKRLYTERCQIIPFMSVFLYLPRPSFSTMSFRVVTTGVLCLHHGEAGSGDPWAMRRASLVSW